MEVTLDQETFVSTLACSPRFSFDGPSNMVYEFLRIFFISNDFADGFNLFFKVCGHIIQGHVSPLFSHLFFTF